MFFQRNNFQTHFKRLLALQKSTAKNYQRIEDITTDEYIISIVSEMRKNHEYFFKGILSQNNPDNLSNKPFHEVKNYIESRWQKIVINLIVNDKSKILEHLWQAEIKILQNINPVLKKFHKNIKLHNQIVDYEKTVYLHLDNLDVEIKALKSQSTIAA